MLVASCQLSVATDHGPRTDPIPQSEIRNQMARHFSPRPANGPIVVIGGKNSTTIFGRGGFNAVGAENAEGRGGGGSGVSGQGSGFRNPHLALDSGLWTLDYSSASIPQSAFLIPLLALASSLWTLDFPSALPNPKSSLPCATVRLARQWIPSARFALLDKPDSATRGVSHGQLCFDTHRA